MGTRAGAVWTMARTLRTRTKAVWNRASCEDQGKSSKDLGKTL